jgi:hypothetical protein
MNRRRHLDSRFSTSHKLVRRGVLRALLGALGASWFGTDEAFADAPAGGFVVIVHAQNPSNAASRELLSDIFLKKITRWEDGEAARPVDLPPDSPVRRAFSNSVIRRPVAAVRHYWQQRIFSGRDVPPTELESDDAVVHHVAKHRGAVGYVSPETKLAGVKPLSVR